MGTSEIKTLLTAVDNASSVVKNVENSYSKLNRGFKDLTGISLGAAGGLALLGKGISAVSDFTKASISETVEYNKQIREMTQVTGLGAEEISRIVQVGDDWGISIESIRTSLAFMNKTGVTPSINNLAALADEYVNTSDKSAFAEKAVKLLGRGYQTLIPLLAKGGDALRAQTDSIDDSLIATQKEIDASRAYEAAVDELGDAWTGFKTNIGNAIIPTLTGLLGTINNINNAIRDEKQITDDYDELLARGLVPVVHEAMTIVDEYGYVIEEGTSKIELMKQAIEGHSGALVEDERLIQARNSRMVEAIDTTEEFTEATNEAAMAIYDLEKKALAQAIIKELNAAFEAGTISENTYKVKMAEVMREMLGMDEKAVATTLSMELLKDQLDAGELSAAQYADAVRRLYDEMNNLDGKVIHTEIQLNYSQFGAGTGQKTGRQHGGPVSGGIPYIVGEAGPELFIPNISGMIKPNQTINNNQQYNQQFHLHTNAPGNTSRDFAIEKARAG